MKYLKTLLCLIESTFIRIADAADGVKCLTCLGLLLIAVSCLPPAPSDAPDYCAGADCGSPDDCQPLCVQIQILACDAQWKVDPSDGACLYICREAFPSLCPKFAAAATSCDEIDRRSVCGK